MLKGLPADEFLILLRTTYAHLLATLKIVDAHHEVLDNLIEDAQKSQPPQDKPSIGVESDLRDIVFAAAELANVKLSKLLTARGEENARLPLQDFVWLFEENWSFVVECEVICKRMIVGLRGAIVSQAKAFLQHFHQQSVSLSAKLVEEEQWSVVDIPASSQGVVALILEGAVTNHNDLLVKRSGPSPTATTNGEVSAKQVDIEGRQYFAVSACLRCLDTLLEYLKIVVNIPLLTTDAMSKIVEFLKQFNSRTCQVVLGAGAMRSAGLKNITAKHLALACQCLSILISLIPYVRELLRRHLNQKQAVMLVEFDKLKRDYQEHQNEIYSKLVSIMSDRLAVHCKALQAVDWTQDIASPANSYMEALTKETTTLHRVLSRYMPGEPLELVMMQVMSSITTRLAEEYGKLDLANDAARDRVTNDARYLKSRLGELKGLERTAPGSVSGGRFSLVD
jgi:vacuolar protein sorting-associated protein 54